MLQDVHRWISATSFATTFLAVFSAPTAATLARVEMGTTKVSSSIVVGSVPLSVPTSLAVCKELFVRRDVNTHPDFSYDGVNTLNVTSKLMFSVKAIGLVVAHGAICFLPRWTLD
jgi:hypothetical protein